MRSIKKNLYAPTNLDIEEINKNSIRLVAYPFEEGCAVTIAHPMRRLLLTSSVGYAPTAIRIEGVSHEFDSMRGILEDVTPFILNIKNLVFKINEDYKDDDKIELNYDFSGPLELNGKHLNNEFVEIINGDDHVVSIGADAKLNFSLIIQKGMGYVDSENIREYVAAPYIALDADFTPVKKAIYRIENMLHDGNPNYEKMILEIETNGQIDSMTAFKEAMSNMHAQMSVFGVNVGDISNNNAYGNDDIPAKLLASIDSLGLEHRPNNCLQKIGIKYIGELVLMSESEVRAIRNLGKKSYDEIASKLEEHGYPIGTQLSAEVASNLDKRIKKLKQ